MVEELKRGVRSGALSGAHLAVSTGTGVTAAADPSTPTGWRIFWIAYAVIGGLVELVALFRPQAGDTASETVWWLRGPVNGWRAFAIVAACLWLALHFGFSLFT